MESILDAIDKGGVLGILVFLIITGAKQVWVFGWMFQRAEKEREEWKKLALRGTRLLENAAEKHSDEDA